METSICGGMMKIKYKHIEFMQIANPNRKTSKWEIHNHQTGDWLGSVQWDRAWRQYVSITPGAGEYRFARSCHLDIAHFIKQLMDEQALKRNLDNL